MYNPFSLIGKQILVTGASSGIGRAIAVECSKMGGKLIITGRNAGNTDITLKMLEGNDHKAIVADFNIRDNLSLIPGQVDKLDGVVFCAGMTTMVPVKFINMEKLHEIMHTNFFANAFITKNLIKNKKLNPSASIIFISSISTYYPAVGGSMYAASKGAIRSFAKVLAKELSPNRIRVNTVEPGIIETDLLSGITEEQLEADRHKYLLGRHGTPADVAGMVVYLLSDSSKWVTGTDIVIDGGASLH